MQKSNVCNFLLGVRATVIIAQCYNISDLPYSPWSTSSAANVVRVASKVVMGLSPNNILPIKLQECE